MPASTKRTLYCEACRQCFDGISRVFCLDLDLADDVGGWSRSHNQHQETGLETCAAFIGMLSPACEERWRVSAIII